MIEIRELPDDLHDDAVALWHEVGLTRPWNDPHDDLRRALRGPASTILAALDGDRLVGTAMTGHDGHRGWVYYLAVSPGHRGTGLGRRIMAAVEEWLAPHVPKVQLMVRTDNAEAAGFYRALGYEDSDALVLARRLDESAR